jgi:O-acetyl-ADP-ribose deacetylase (regulator of RNase III)
MLVAVTLVDINPKMIAAWRSTFEENPEVQIVQGSMLDMPVSAWVSPTNSRGSMDGGLDLVIKKSLGAKIEKAVQQEISARYSGSMPVGHAVCVSTGQIQPAYLISTPTMVGSSDDISDTMNVALACCAAFQAVHQQNHRSPGSVRSIAVPGLGANTGKVPVEICADLMWTAYQLFREKEFLDFNEMRVALQEQLGDLGPMSGKTPTVKIVSDDDDDFDEDDFDDDAKPKPTSKAPQQPKSPPAKPKPADEDFDDFD